MRKQPNVTLKMIFRSQGRILILRHPDGNYDFPGGRMEWGEDLFEALQREIKEELDFTIKKQPSLFHVWNYISKDADRHSVMIYFYQELSKPILFVSPEKIKTQWLKKSEMKKVIHHQDFVHRLYAWGKHATKSSMYYSK